MVVIIVANLVALLELAEMSFEMDLRAGRVFRRLRVSVVGVWRGRAIEMVARGERQENSLRNRQNHH